MIQPTSKNAYAIHKETGKAQSQRDRIWIIIRYNRKPLTNREIAQILQMEPSTVSARRNELIKKGWVKKGSPRKCSITDITAYTWVVR